MVPRRYCSVGGLTFSRNFFKPLLPRHIWRKIQLESDSLPYNQLIFLFSYRFFFTTGPTSNPQKTSAPPDQSRLLCLVTSSYFPTSFSSRGLQGPHHHHLYHHHHDPTRRTRRDGPDETDPLTNQPDIIIIKAYKTNYEQHLLAN